MSVREVLAVIDNDPRFSQSLVGLMDSVDIDVHGYESAQHFFREDGLRDCNCLLIDVFLPEINGLQLYDQLRQRGVLRPVILTSGLEIDGQDAMRCGQAGVVGFLPKPCRHQQIIDLVQTSMAQERLVRKIVEQRDALREELDTLTPAQSAVFWATCASHNSAQIAEKLRIQASTLDHHRREIKARLQLHSLQALVAFGCRFQRLDALVRLLKNRPGTAFSPDGLNEEVVADWKGLLEDPRRQSLLSPV